MNELNKSYLACNTCSKQYKIEEQIWKCTCGGILDVKGCALFSKQSLKNCPMNFWRYSSALAFNEDFKPEISLGEVITPLINTIFRGLNITFKAEYLLPTGSYKDRGIAVCINHLKTQRIKNVSEDSSGNAGASVSAYSAAAGMNANIFVPDYTSPAKINQIEFYGAKCHLVKGSRTDCSNEAQKPIKNTYYIGHSYNPLFACGIKTVAYEIAEQYNWVMPDVIVTPLGGGSLVLGLIDGFNELYNAQYINKIPKVLAVQTAACAPIFKAYAENKNVVNTVELNQTCAEGVALPNPARGTQVLKAVKENNAGILAVNDDEILSAWKDMAKIGIYIEPTSAVAVAGVWQAVQNEVIDKNENIVVLLTGHGLKSKPSLLNK